MAAAFTALPERSKAPAVLRFVTPVFLFCASLALSCTNTTRPDFLVHLVTPNGSSPFIDGSCSSGVVRVDVQQGTGAVLTSNGSFTNGTLNNALRVQIASYGQLTQIQVTVSCASGGRLIGSTPHFVPVGYGFVDVVIGAPNSCETLSWPTLTPARAEPTLVTLGANVLVVGGRATNGEAFSQFQLLDPIQLTVVGEPHSIPDPAFTVDVGVGGAAPLTQTVIVFVPDVQPSTFDATQGATTPRAALTGVHPGAGSESTVVVVPSYGVAIVGGFDGGDGVSGITWVRADGSDTTTTELSSTRRHPAVVPLGSSRLLVAGGQAEGMPLFEIVSNGGNGTPVTGSPTEARYRAVAASDLAHSHALVALGSASADDPSMLRSSTYVLSACTATNCTITAGPTLAGDQLRSGVTAISHRAGTEGTSTPTDVYETLLVGGVDASGAPSRAIDRIRFDGATATVAGFAQLVAPRGVPGATDIGGGIVLVAGGADERDNAITSVEICFPAELRPITSVD